MAPRTIIASTVAIMMVVSIRAAVLRMAQVRSLYIQVHEDKRRCHSNIIGVNGFRLRGKLLE